METSALIGGVMEPSLRWDSQFLLVFCTSLIGPGIYALTRGTLTIQTFLLAPNCAMNKTVDCCENCLGMTPQEYGLSLALPTYVAFPLIFFTGAIIDFFGLPTATIMVSALSVFGAILHASVVYITNHIVVLFIFSLGNLCGTVAVFWFTALSQFLAIRYFKTKWQSLVISIIYSCSTLGAVATGLLSPRIALSYGFEFALWSIVLENAALPFAAVAIWLLFKCKKDLIRFERYRLSFKSYEVVNRSASFIFNSIRSFKFDYWLITFVIGLTAGSMTPYMSNVPFIQTTLFDISKVEIAQGMSFGWLIQIALLPIIGLHISFFKTHCISAFFGMVIEAVMFIMILIPNGSPLTANCLIALPYSVTLMSISPLIDPFVPSNALGLASSVSTAFNSFCCSVMLIVTGVVLNGPKRWLAVHNCLFLLLGLLGVQVLLLVILVVRLKLTDRTSKKRSDYQFLADSSDDQ